MKNFVLVSLIIASLSIDAQANVPVIDGYQVDPQQTVGSPATLSQRITRLEQQVEYINQTNLTGEIAEIQQAMQTLRGQLEVQAHRLHQVQLTQNNIDKRFAQLIAHNTSDAATHQQSTMPIAVNQVSGDAEQKIYDEAFQLINQRHYDSAITGMKDYLHQYPDGHFAANATYWLGELYLLRGDYNHAIDAFQKVIKQYPKSNKVADAMLKLGFAFYDKGELKNAKHNFYQVTKLYPGTVSARLAKARLQNDFK